MEKTIEIPEGYEARIEGNKVILEPKESEDERIRNGLLRHFKNKTKPYWSEIAVKDIIAYLEKQKEQMPAEWSEEDKRLLRTTLECLNYVSCQSKTPVVNWLKSLPERFNLQQKQEWSEEDEGMLNCIIATLCEESHGGRESNGKMVIWLENRLKSLRPQSHWKPSEEQIDALEHFIRSWGESGTMSPQNTILCAAKSLYTDLKKLL